jgi:HD superfamily phosphohydrolase
MKKRTFLDPVHGNIELDKNNPEEKLILDLIETPQFQRLRRIRQLGFSYLTYYGAEGTRFVHSIGTFQVARQILNELSSKYKNTIEKHRTAILVAALLHDIGHGPFSHSSEPAFQFRHEEWTLKNILGDTEIRQLLTAYKKGLDKEVASILQEKTKPSWTCQIVSGQLDCDRADYLIRDSHQTGTKYGVFQLDRVIKSLELAEYKNETQLVVGEKGLQAVEDYLFARYSMYLQVYHHKKTLSADALFTSLFSRVRDLLQTNKKVEISKSLSRWLQTSDKSLITLQDFWEVDDACILEHLKNWASNAKDEILADLSQRLLNRNLFKAKKVNSFTTNQIKSIRKKLGEEKAQYYCLVKECREFPYNDKKKPILVNRNGKIQELSKASSIAAALLNKDKELDIEWLFAPKEYFDS